MSPARTTRSNRLPWLFWLWCGFLCMPVACGQELGVQRSFRRARLGVPVVAPFYDRRQRHQDGFGAAARLQAEQRAAVIHQIELDVAAATVGLEVAFAFAVCDVLATFEDGQIGGEKGVAHAPRHREGMVEAAFGKVVVER